MFKFEHFPTERCDHGLTEIVFPKEIRFEALGPVYTKRQGQCGINAKMTLAILLSLKSIDTFGMRLQPFRTNYIFFQWELYHKRHHGFEVLH